MTARPALTPDQQSSLIDPRYPRDFSVRTPDPQRLVPLIGQLCLSMDGAESGAPMTDPNTPLTTGAPWEAVALALGTQDAQALLDGWLDMATLVRTAAWYGQIAPGTYDLRNRTQAQLMDALAGYGWSAAEAGFDADGRVTLTEQKIILLRNQMWQWTHDEIGEEIYHDGGWPGPSVDPKRVYGDMSFIELDMHRVLELPIERRDDRGYIQLSDAQLASLSALHSTMLPATQVFLENVTLDLGAPELADHVRTWAEGN